MKTMADLTTWTAETSVVEEHVWFGLSTLCHASGADLEQMRALVAEGLLQPTGASPGHGQFPGDDLPQTHKALRLARDRKVDLAAVALVTDQLAETDRLGSRPPS
jgi:chaperone modulatory protein CbpM